MSDQLSFLGDDPERGGDDPAVADGRELADHHEVTTDEAVDAGDGASRPRPPSFQAAAGIQGRQFAEQCDTLLTHQGFELRGRRVLAEVGVEIDQEVRSPTGRLVWFEYKGSVQGDRPGLRRTDTLKKAIANGALLRSLADPAPYVVITSHLPESGAGAAMLAAALRLGYLTDVVCLYDPKAVARLRRW
jgi:hypothetical protein